MAKESVMELRRHELLEDIHAQVASVAGEYGVEDDVADQIGCAIADHMAKNWGGQNFTFPKDIQYQISTRDEQIYADFNGTNHHILAKRYKVGVRAIYKIIARVRAKGDPNQGKLF